MNKVIAALIVTLIVFVGLAGLATAADPDAAVKARQAVFKEMGKTMKALGAIAKGDIQAQRDDLVALSGKMRELAPQPWANFGQETAVTRLETEAKTSIWADPAGFKQAQANFIAASDALALVAAKGEPKVIAEKITALGDTCGACHKQFKE